MFGAPFAMPQVQSTGAMAVQSKPGVGVPPGTVTFVLADGSVVSLVDWIDDKIYATVELYDTDSSEIEAFGPGRSQQIPGGTRSMSKVDSNVPRAGDSGLPQGWEALVFSIAVDCVRIMRAPASGGVTLADAGVQLSDPPAFRSLWELNRLLYMYFEYNGKKYCEGTPLDFPAGRGFTFGGTANDIHVANSGNPSPRDRVAMVLPIKLEPNQAYKMVFTPAAALNIAQAASDGSTALDYADYRTTLYGLIKKPVT